MIKGSEKIDFQEEIIGEHGLPVVEELFLVECELARRGRLSATQCDWILQGNMSDIPYENISFIFNPVSFTIEYSPTPGIITSIELSKDANVYWCIPSQRLLSVAKNCQICISRKKDFDTIVYSINQILSRSREKLNENVKNKENSVCPVCNSSCSDDERICMSCGFSDLNREFINNDDAKHWKETVLIPFKNHYYSSKQY